SMKNDQFREIAGAHAYHSAARTYQWNNKNRLLTELYEYCIAGKTGYTAKAGRTLVKSATNAEKESVVGTCNAADDRTDHPQFCEWPFAKQTNKTMNKQMYEAPIYKNLIQTMSSIMRKIIYG